MVDRVTGSSAGSAQRVASSTTSPTDGAAINQAAADFASLLGDHSAESAPEPRANDPIGQRDDPYDDRRVEERDQREQSHDDSNDSHDDGQKKKGESPLKNQPTPGDAILQNLQKAELLAGKSEATAQMGPAQSLEGIVQQVANKILVSDTSSGREVRIFLKDSLLPGTEVRIAQQAGKMQVQFFTDSAKSQEVLTQNQAALQQRLSEKLGGQEVVVAIEMDSQGHGDQPQGESRGKIEELQDDDQA